MYDKEIVATGERFIPEVKDEELEIEHLERYLCIQELVKGKSVLDAACGEGYGSHILSQTAESVLGVDIDAETVQRAKEKYGESSKLNYKQASVTDLSIVPSESVDVVVSYETIEHIDEESQVKFLNEIARVLKSSGILIMSTPDKKEYTDKYNFNNPFHVKEFYIHEFVDFLKTKFQHVKIYNQYLEVASFIDCPEEKITHIQYSIDRERYDSVAKYVIAIASNVTLPEQSISMAFMHLRREYMPIMEELNYCRKEAIECRKKAERLDECLNEIKLNHEELERREIELQKRMDLINEIQSKNIELEQIRKSQQEELDSRAMELDHRMNEINFRDGELDKQRNEMKLLNEELERRAIELDHRMDEINFRDGELDRRAIELDNRMEKINELQGELDQIKNYGFVEVMKWFLGKNR